jgi:hypothetical protein
MTLTRRSFLHITEVTRAFQIREGDFITAAAHWPYKIKGSFALFPSPSRDEANLNTSAEMHEQLIEDLRIEAAHEAAYSLARGVTAEEAQLLEKKANECVSSLPAQAHH